MELLQLDPNLKSLPSPAAYLHILNGTKCIVDIYWIDFQSKLVRLSTLEPRKATPINTHTLHPWVFIDQCTGQLLNVRNQRVLYGKSTRLRELVIVHLPLKSLQDTALLCLLKHLQNVDAVEQLEIPQALKRDLRNAFRIFEEHKKRLREETER